MQQDASSAGIEADGLCGAIASHAGALRDARLGASFRLGIADFVLVAQARNTIYRIRGTAEWYLKLTRDGSVAPMEHERLGAGVIGDALTGHPSYSGAAVTRVSLDPPFVLASAIPGQVLNRLFVRECWTPSRAAGARLETTFQALGSLLAALHEAGRVVEPALPATTRPFKVVDHMLERVRESDPVVDEIGAWQETHRQSDDGHTFQHGNFRLDNILRTPTGLGFIDLENCGTGSPYQDLSRPVLDLVLTRAAAFYPRARVQRCLAAFLTAYARARAVDSVQLWKLVAVRLSRYYLEARARRFTGRLGGVPVSKAKLDRLVLSFLRAEPESIRLLDTSPPR